MRRREALYLLAVAASAVLFAGDVISRATTGGSARTAAPAGVAGEARDVDVERLRRLIREGRLSDREALYAKPAGGAAVPKDEDDD